METKVITLQLDYFSGDSKFTVYPVVLKSKDDTILVDCGFSNSLDLLESELKKHDISLEDLTGLYLTHEDHNHMGNAFELKNRYPKIQIIASAAEQESLSIAVDAKVFDFDVLNTMFDCRILSTKGHTPGHTSLYLPKQKTLILGDAAVIENDELVLGNPQYCLDLEEAKKSLEMLKKLEVETYICYHRGVFNKNK